MNLELIATIAFFLIGFAIYHYRRRTQNSNANRRTGETISQAKSRKKHEKKNHPWRKHLKPLSLEQYNQYQITLSQGRVPINLPAWYEDTCYLATGDLELTPLFQADALVIIAPIKYEVTGLLGETEIFYIP